VGGQARPLATRAGVLALALSAGVAHAAGGHHAVDDATLLDPGRCELEGWATGFSGGGQLFHAGANCRAGPVELGVAGLRGRLEGEGRSDYGIQVKWARQWHPRLSVGWSLTPAWQARPESRYLGLSAAALLTWSVRDDLALHLNLARDFAHGGPDQSRSGVAAEWTARAGWSLVAERYEEERTQFLRAGVRLAVTHALSVDLSHAQRLSGSLPSRWTLGTTWQFGRP